jgi:tetratricopeptide (TPR) repeat protein
LGAVSLESTPFLSDLHACSGALTCEALPTSATLLCRPQLHDIVREYVISLHSPEELQNLQQRAVEAFAAQRPLSTSPKFPGQRYWALNKDMGAGSAECAAYVSKSIRYHVRAAMGASEVVPSCVESWLSHFPYTDDAPDLISRAIQAAVPQEWCVAMAHRAIKAEEWYMACTYITAWFEHLTRQHRSMEVFTGKHNELFGAFWNAVQQTCATRPSQLDETQHELWQIAMWKHLSGWFAVFGDQFVEHLPFVTHDDGHASLEKLGELIENPRTGNDYSAWAEELEEMRSNAGGGYTAFKVGDWDVWDTISYQRNKQKLAAAMELQATDHSAVRDIVAALLGNGRELRLAEWDWSLLDRVDVMATLCSYDDVVAAKFYWSGTEVAAMLPAIRGDIATANSALDTHTSTCRQVHAKPVDQEASYSALSGAERSLAFLVHGMGVNHQAWVLHMLGRTADALSLMTELDFTWATADARVDAYGKLEENLRGRGEPSGVVTMRKAEDLSWCIRLQYVLCSTWREVAAADVVAALPSPDTLESYLIGAHAKHEGFSLHFSRMDACNLLVMAAEVCEKLDRPADALLYLNKALRTEPNKPAAVGTERESKADTESKVIDPTMDWRPMTHAHGNSVRGRMLAKQGQKAEAEAAFETAIEVSHRTGLRLFEMFALRDLKKHILDADGRGEEGTKRLKAVLQEMKGPASELTKLLGGGLDAEEIQRA